MVSLLPYNEPTIANIGGYGSFDTLMSKAQIRTKVAPAMYSAEPILAWKVHLLREEPRKMLLIAPVVSVSLVVGYVFTHSLLLPAVTLFLFMCALSEYLFPVRYQLSETDAAARTLLSRTRVEWDRVRKYYLDDRGIKLSTLGKPGRLEAYRGLYLRFGENREEIIEVVRKIRDGRAVDG